MYANSTPTAPPPTMTTDAGSAGRSSASRLVSTTSPSISSPGSVRSQLPLARRTKRAPRRSPSPPMPPRTRPAPAAREPPAPQPAHAVVVGDPVLLEQELDALRLPVGDLARACDHARV